MSIDFNRNRAQLAYESIVGISAPDELPTKRTDFKSHILTTDEATRLKLALQEDAVDFFYNGILSFCEGIDASFQKRFSWATVEFYYAVYYLIRATMAAKGIAILRCSSMFQLVAKPGKSPVGHNAKRYSTTHEGTISYYRDIFDKADTLLSNTIDDVDAYEWMKNAREIVNYRCRAFLEPGCLSIWEHFSKCVDDGTLAAALSLLESDPYVKCFQEEYAIIAIPIKRMQQTIADMHASGLLHNLHSDRSQFAKSVIEYDSRSLTILAQIFGV